MILSIPMRPCRIGIAPCGRRSSRDAIRRAIPAPTIWPATIRWSPTRSAAHDFVRWMFGPPSAPQAQPIGGAGSQDVGAPPPADGSVQRGAAPSSIPSGPSQLDLLRLLASPPQSASLSSGAPTAADSSGRAVPPTRRTPAAAMKNGALGEPSDVDQAPYGPFRSGNAARAIIPWDAMAGAGCPKY